MLRMIEQKYLLKMLENNRQFPNNDRPYNFYKVIRSMLKKGLIQVKNRNNKKVYRLTNYGWSIACCIAKDFDTEPKYKKYAREVELWII